ncbi:hypothetical protein [Paracraurococcus lichenis]|uniref:Tetratricopeptide repeat protein n=1 Tax=Paracraurococcus lichenis TaxID=3064888 RepID=A0ABT9DZP4_9PROT|nr:hypothetical protein [Paracraurococcus sp. LOR1-02]MDO9709355.1 hypothetical protein [Paracraurococcus sp. LOR1-02]
MRRRPAGEGRRPAPAWMGGARPWQVLALAAALALPPAAALAERVTVRSGDHPGFGRLVFDWPALPAWSLQQQGDGVLLRVPAGTTLQPPARLPRNLLSLAEEPEGIRLVLRPGASAKAYRLGARVVVDVADPPAQPPAPERTRAAARPVAASPPPAGPVEARSRARRTRGAAPPEAPSPPPALAAPSPPAPAASVAAMPTSPAAPAAAAPAPPVALPAARPARPLPGGQAVLLPVPAGTGAAVVRRGGEVLAVLDSAEAPDLAPLRGHPVFGALVADPLPGATLLRLPLAPPGQLRARREAAGWVLEAIRPAPALEGAPALMPEAEPGPPPRLLLKAAAPGRVVPVADPETGLPLLLGTLREGAEALPVGRRLPEFDLLPSLLGAAVLARSDGVAVQALRGRFGIAAAGGARFALDAGVTQPPAAPAMTRSFDLPDQPPAELLNRAQALQAAIAGAAPLTRLAQRRAAGEALLALGLPQEAQAMLALGFAEDPRATADAGYAALAGAAALLAGRLAEAGALRAPDWPESDEATLWRAALAAAQGEWREAGPGFAATMPLLLAYPAALRARLLPLAALALAEAGERAALARLLGRAGEAAEDLVLPRAILAELDGKPEEALALYDRAAAGRDRQARARAIRRGVELRLVTGAIDAKAAARALEAALYAWRGDRQELETRLRLATLRRGSGDARGALALLRETAAMLPEQAEALQPAIRDAFLAGLAESPPLAAVALFDAFPELLPADPRGEEAMLVLADRLLALDLGDRAAALLRQAMERAAGTSRAALGLRLAALRLQESDLSGAEAALADSAAPELPAGLAQPRAVLAARLDARRGRVPEAVAALRALGPAGGEALAELLTESTDWAGAAAALGTHLAATLPAPPATLADAQRRLLLRQAALLALAGDEPALAALRESAAARMGEGPLAEAFALLTADPLRGLADLPRLQRELQLFRSLPARLEALRAGAPVTR